MPIADRFSMGSFWLAGLICLAFASPAQAQANDFLQPLETGTAAGSAEPRLSRGADGTLVLSWLEPADKATRLRYSKLGETGWSEPATVAEGDNWFVNWADFPSVVPISDSLWAAHWLSKRPGGVYAYDVSVSLSRDGGKSWGAPVVPHRDGTTTEHGFVSLFPWQEGVGMVWLDGRNTTAAGADHAHAAGGGMTLRSAVMLADGSLTAETEMDALVCDCCQTGVAIGSDGPIAVYRNRTDGEIRDIYLARSVVGQWQEEIAVANDGWEIAGCPVNGPAIAAAGDQVAVAWFTMANDLPRVRFAWSHDAGRSFGQALDIDQESPMGRVGVTLLANGSAAVSWLDSDEKRKGAIKVKIISPDNQPGEEYVIAPSATTRPAGFPQIAADGNNLLMAWTDTSGDATRVRTARIVLSP